MYYELYLDVLFLRNLLLDYLLLRLLKRLLKCPAGKGRQLAAAVLGSCGVCLWCLWFPEQPSPGSLVFYLFLGGIMAALGLSPSSIRALAKTVILLYVCGIFLGGTFAWLQKYLHFPVYSFLGLSLLSYILLHFAVNWFLRFRTAQQNFLEGTLIFRGQKERVQMLLDTGNRLSDPVFGKPVSIISERLWKALCKEEEVCYYAVPFHSVGRKNGILKAFFADLLILRTADGEERRIERPLLGITKEPLSSKDEYEMILHPQLLE